MCFYVSPYTGALTVYSLIYNVRHHIGVFHAARVAYVVCVAVDAERFGEHKPRPTDQS